MIIICNSCQNGWVLVKGSKPSVFHPLSNLKTILEMPRTGVGKHKDDESFLPRSAEALRQQMSMVEGQNLWLQVVNIVNCCESFGLTD